MAFVSKALPLNFGGPLYVGPTFRRPLGVSRPRLNLTKRKCRLLQSSVGDLVRTAYLHISIFHELNLHHSELILLELRQFLEKRRRLSDKEHGGYGCYNFTYWRPVLPVESFDCASSVI